MTSIHNEPTQITDFNQVAVLIGAEQINTTASGENVEVEIEPPPAAQASFSINAMFVSVFDSLQNAMPFLQLQATEVDVLADSWTQAVGYWFPDFTELTPNKNLVATHAIVFLPRIFGFGNSQATNPKQQKEPKDWRGSYNAE